MLLSCLSDLLCASEQRDIMTVRSHISQFTPILEFCPNTYATGGRGNCVKQLIYLQFTLTSTFLLKAASL